jgi:hypothetical protein
MPRPRTPTHLLELRGSFKKNPQRGRARAERVYVAPPPAPEPYLRSAPNKFQPRLGLDSPRKKKLREIWDCVIRDWLLPVRFNGDITCVCELLWRCQYGSPSVEDIKVAKKWVKHLGVSSSLMKKAPPAPPTSKRPRRLNTSA